jgi:multiple sugar transport system permease protein
VPLSPIKGIKVIFKLSYRQKNTLRPYTLLIPAFLAIASIIAYPVVRAFAMSFQSYSLLKPNDIKFIAFGNFIRAFKDEVFWYSLGRTVFYIIGTVGFQFVFGFILALLLNSPSVFSRIARNLMLIPWVIPGVLAAFMFRWLFNANYGLINAVLVNLKIIDSNIAWLTDPKYAMPSVIVASIWKGFSFFALMLFAGLQAVPKELYEAARIDGANRVQQLFFVTIPSIMPVIVTTTLLRIIWTANFVDIIYNMTEGGPGYNTQILSVYTFMISRSTMDYGYAAALSILLTLFMFIIILLYVKQARKEELL